MLQWYVITSGGLKYPIDTADWTYKRFQEEGKPRPSEATLTLDRNAPVLEKQWVGAVEFSNNDGSDTGQVKFLGYVNRKPSLSSASKEVSCKGVEDLLWKRPCPKLTYSASDTTLNHLFASLPPWINPDTFVSYWQPGLLDSANSLMAPGWIASEFMSPIPASIEPGIVYGPRWYPTYANDIIKLRFCGKKSCFGTHEIYHDWHQFAEYSSLEELESSTDTGIYRDDIDLYIHIPRSPLPSIYSSAFGYVYGNWFCHNAFDIKVRRGTIDLAATLISDPITVGPDSLIGDICVNIAKVHKQKIRFRYENDWLAYMDVLEDFADDGIVDVYEEYCSKIDYPADSDLHPDTLIGLGNGERLFKAAYSVFDPRPGFAHIVETVDFDKSFEDYSGNLAPYVSILWEELRDKQIIEITSRYYDQLLPGNTVRLHVVGEPNTTYEVASIERHKNAPSKISLGKRRQDITDAYNAREEASSTYLINDLEEVGSQSFNGIIGVGDWGHEEIPFLSEPLYLPAYAGYSAYNPAILLDISISNRQNCFTPIDVSSLFYIEMATNVDALPTSRVANSETIQYMIGEPVSINVMGNVTWNSKNYIKVHSILNGFWPAYDRTHGQVLADIVAPSDGSTRNRDDYNKGVWGRYLNKEHYAILVLLEPDLYAYQLQAPGNLDINKPWLIGNGDKVAKELFYSFVTSSGRSKATVLAEILTPATDYNRTTYYNGFWGQTQGSGYYAIVIKVDAGDMYAYQIQPPGSWIPENPWSFGTSQQAADAIFASSQAGTRTAAQIKAEIDTPENTPEHIAWPTITTYRYAVRGYDVAAYPIAHIIELSENGVATTQKRFAYRIETSSGVYSAWKVDENYGESICAALLEDFTATDLRKQSDIRTDISNLVFAEPDTYSWMAYGYEPPATPHVKLIQVSNVPQVLAYMLTGIDDEEGDWTIDTSSGANIVDLITPAIRYFDISISAKCVRRRLLP